MILHNTHKLLLLLLFFVQIFSGFTLRIKYKFDIDSKYKAEAHINGKHSINGEFKTDYTQYYKVITSILSVNENDLAEIQDDGYYYINNTTIETLKEVKSNILTTYFKDNTGVTFAPTDTPFPVMRNIPYIPDIEITPGTTWDFDGLEVQEFFNDKIISILPVTVNYTFIGMDKELEDICEIKYTITVNVENKLTGSIDSRIRSVNGISNNTLLFNIKTGSPFKEIYNRDYKILTYNQSLDSNFVYEFKDTGERIWTLVEKIPETIMESLKEETKNIDDVTITQDDKGIKLSLDDIKFLPDSATLTETERIRVEKIANIIEKYKDKKTLIVGHTTDRGTEAGRQKLSTERARSVTDFLISKGAIIQENTQIMGQGGNQPVAPNTTLEGLKKNRRVEIYILEE
ncbi:MAG: hypothetical protein A2015_08605 [Spirochaetes bacterium GWF1_31_7]|nr:MAG: hypothetical protein A2Y30_07055 [Spirochaetes bacterium GWE1_32_154]OHD47984.1 MAG: hypothetical protein A2015_08605 [Spirochaetes bacterium GWF1_31_7]OHD48075.1 MAG: hypothetical protein A2Y29_07940 [Spirochaetes bacterium GWE2_31_10]OHD81194.1 MAG: hypothetical protein A2355_00305 [Spirochaetes bacterium RIFOXYB1_FULL_32_8]HBD94076.1 hypothetical protein [Spirochaetia bacterium]